MWMASQILILEVSQDCSQMTKANPKLKFSRTWTISAESENREVVSNGAFQHLTQAIGTPESAEYGEAWQMESCWRKNLWKIVLLVFKVSMLETRFVLVPREHCNSEGIRVLFGVQRSSHRGIQAVQVTSRTVAERMNRTLVEKARCMWTTHNYQRSFGRKPFPQRRILWIAIHPDHLTWLHWRKHGLSKSQIYSTWIACNVPCPKAEEEEIRCEVQRRHFRWVHR